MRILTSYLYIRAKLVSHLFFLFCSQDILGTAGQRVCHHIGNHTSDRKIRPDGVSETDRHGTGHKLVMKRLKPFFRNIRLLCKFLRPRI